MFKFNWKWESSVSILLISSYLCRAIICLEYSTQGNICIHALKVEKSGFLLLLATMSIIISWNKSHTYLSLAHTWKHSPPSSIMTIIQSDRHNCETYWPIFELAPSFSKTKRKKEYSSSEFWKWLFDLVSIYS